VEPLLDLVAIAVLRPTQITVGMAEVDKKRRRRCDVMEKGIFPGRH
jgi:hypothetical protein